MTTSHNIPLAERGQHEVSTDCRCQPDVEPVGAAGAIAYHQPLAPIRSQRVAPDGTIYTRYRYGEDSP